MQMIEKIPGLSAAQRKQLRENCKRGLDNPRAAEQAQAVLAALEAFEAGEADKRAKLCAEVAALPPTERIVRTFEIEPMSDDERKLVQVLLDNPKSTSAHLTAAMAWQGDDAWHLHFGRMCRKRQALLGLAPPAGKRKTPAGDQAQFYSGLLTIWHEDSRSHEMSPEAGAAFAVLGLKPTR